ncbi:MAG: GDSL-type esterase/lipase family protein, partial [Bacteroidota bacterium]
GSGDTTGAGGYVGHLARLLEKRGWKVVNVSRGGDNTSKILPRFESQLIPVKPAFVIIGLSLGNEGIASGSDLNRERTFEKFRSGMISLINRCHENGMVPVVVNCYARNDFGKEQYAVTKKMNLVINTWDVPSINVLGTIDNGSGQWVDGYWHDRSHPDYQGHHEMFYAFVPSLFDAMVARKKTPSRSRSNSYLLICGEKSFSPVVFSPDDTIHSFTVSFVVKTKDTGCLAAIYGGEEPSFIRIKDGKLSYHSHGRPVIESDTSGESKGWQYIVVAHQYASGITSYYTNGVLAGTLKEKVSFRQFVLGGSGEKSKGPAPSRAGYKDLLIYRSALNGDEVKALYYDQLLQSSLELYAPLNDAVFITGENVTNCAQSLSNLRINGSSLISAEN